jgi:hypothetical protein
MKKLIITLFLALVAVSTVHCEMPSCDFGVQTGYRHDDLNWSIGGLNGKPNILSELKWKKIQIAEIEANLRVLADSYYAKGSLSYGEVLDGSCRDSDYLLNNRKAEFSRSSLETSHGSVYDWSLAGGYELKFWRNLLSINPLGGYAVDHQHYKMNDGVQLIDWITDYSGPIHGLNSSYTSNFKGPFIGVDFIYEATSDLTLLATYEYHFIDYKGSGDWNLRKDLYKDFQHRAKGRGVVGSLGFLYDISYQLSIGMTCSYTAFETKKGSSRFYALMENNEGEIVKEIFNQPFNGIRWKSLSALLSLNYAF